MIEVEMSKDVRECEPKLIGPFTKRQLICVLIGLGYGVPIFFLLHGIPEITVRIIIAGALAAPTFACGWCKLYGLPLERFLSHIVKTQLMTPTKRVVAYSNTYEILKEELDAQEESQQPKSKKKKQKVNYPKDNLPIK